MRLTDYIDVLIPRGGGELIRRVKQESTVPVIETGEGNCHIYVDASADLGRAEEIVVNAKCQRPGVCNAAETLLVHQAVAADFLPRIGDRLTELGVELRACERSLRHGPCATWRVYLAQGDRPVKSRQCSFVGVWSISVSVGSTRPNVPSALS